MNASSPNHWTVREFLTMSLQSQTWCPGDEGRKEGKRKGEEREEGRRGPSRAWQPEFPPLCKTQTKHRSLAFRSVQSLSPVRLCHPTDRSTPGFPVRPLTRKGKRALRCPSIAFLLNLEQNLALWSFRENLWRVQGTNVTSKCNLVTLSAVSRAERPGGQGGGQSPPACLMISHWPTKTTSDR